MVAGSQGWSGPPLESREGGCKIAENSKDEPTHELYIKACYQSIRNSCKSFRKRVCRNHIGMAVVTNYTLRASVTVNITEVTKHVTVCKN